MSVSHILGFKQWHVSIRVVSNYIVGLGLGLCSIHITLSFPSNHVYGFRNSVPGPARDVDHTLLGKIRQPQHLTPIPSSSPTFLQLPSVAGRVRVHYERGSAGNRDCGGLFPGPVPPPSLWRLQEAAAHGSLWHTAGVVSVLSHRLHSSTGCQHGWFGSRS